MKKYEVDTFATVRIRATVNAESKNLALIAIEDVPIDLKSHGARWKIVYVLETIDQCEIEEIREIGEKLKEIM